MTTQTLWVIKQTDESRDDPTASLTDDAELVLPLAAGTAYWVECGVLAYAQYDYAARVPCGLRYSGSLLDEQFSMAHIHKYTSSPGYFNTTHTYTNHFTLVADMLADTSTIDNATGTNNTAYRGLAMYRGRITTDTAGNLSLAWLHFDNGFDPTPGPSKVFAGSFLIATPLNICPL